MLDELDDLLSTTEWSLEGGQQVQLQRALIETIESGCLWRVGNRILDDPVTARKVFAKSSIHDNGFFRITLASTANYGLRLHVWDRRPGGLMERTENIHSHTVDFATVLLLGGYRHDIFEDAEHGDRLHSYVFRAPRDATSYELTPMGTSTVVRTSRAYLPAGTTYSLDGRVLHTVTPAPGRLTVSLVLKGPQYRPSSRVLSSKPIQAGPAVPVPSLPADALERYVTEVLGVRSTWVTPALTES